MKTIKITLALLAIVAVAAIYSTGAFIPETNGMADTVAGLTVLNDTEMAQNVGGPWTQVLPSGNEGGGEHASCVVDNCPDNTFTFTLDDWDCVPCDDSEAYSLTNILVPTKVESWCDDFFVEGIRCDYEEKSHYGHYSCILYLGLCGS